jgi:PAS domain S-box-containing protein
VIVVFFDKSLSVMVRNALDVSTLLAYQIKPALILDSSGTVTAVNEGGVRLIFSHRNAIPGNNGSLVGKNIADLGFVLLPGVPPIWWTWKGILDAAFDVRKPIDGIQENNNNRLRSNSVTNIYSNTTEFWNQEDEHQSVVESDVHVTRNARGLSAYDTMGSKEASSMIRVRATVRWYPSSKNGVFLITFSRTSLPQRPAFDPLVAATERTNDPQENANNRSSLSRCTTPQHVEENTTNSSADLEGMVRSASGIASSIVPYIVVILDTDGQATAFSKSWYKLSGLDEPESLGSGWLTIMHPEDVIEMTIAWIDVLQNERSHWSHQARFRMASDGMYYWFLIRAQAYKDTSGNAIRWYVSMMDINQWVVARLQADRRQQSILTLFSQTDVMLWEIDKANHLYIREGRLNWDPTRIVKLLTRDLRGQTAHIDDTNENTDRTNDDQLVHTIRTVLQGCAISPVVEHWEGDRYFRTRFVAERCHLSDGGNKDRDGVVEAAVALTFDITEEKARLTLQMENKRLMINEQAALDATNLKSRFLANVSP